MAVGRITKRSVEAIPLPVGTARSYLWDDTLKGFGVMVTPAGSRSYLVQYQMGGRRADTQRYTIGRHGSPWTSEKARERAIDLILAIKSGVNVVDEAKRQRDASIDAKADADRLAFDRYVDLFVSRYLETGGRRGKGKGSPLRSAEDIKSTLTREWVSVFKSRPLSSIRKGEITTQIDAVADRSMSAAIKAHKWLRKLLDWAVSRGDIGASPMEHMDPPGQDGKRDRWLQGDEIAVVWKGADAMGEPYAAFTKALFLTGQRLREVAHMNWSEVDLLKAEWVIPGGRTKNKRQFLVPLSSMMVDLLTDLQPERERRVGPVFTTNGVGPINGFSKPKAKLDIEIGKALATMESDELPLMQPWVWHDARRTFSSNCQALGVSRDLVHEAVNQRTGSGGRSGLADRYQLYEYRDEKAAVMEKWARLVRAIVDPQASVVVPIGVARA